jgi:adenylosuccinate synthase
MNLKAKRKANKLVANLVTVGAQWGDEGKAKIVDWLASSADVIVRSQGGCNAGHTVQHEGEVFKFHHLPSGLLYENKLCIIGPGTVISPFILQGELESITAKGYSTQGLRVSERAHVVMPYHVAQDKALEAALSHQKIGTTGRGIGPAYMDKVGRFGLRVGQLFDPDEVLKERLALLVEVKRATVASFMPEEDLPTEASLWAFVQEARAILQPYVCDTVSLLADAQLHGKHLLFEGAQGTLLDVDFGTYPFVTSSNAAAGGACTGGGLGPSRVDETLGVMKAYLTRVGQGPFPTELLDATGDYLVTEGKEIGTTTGRTRRCGWFDAVLARYSVQVNGLDSLALTKLDVLDGLEEISVCVAYKHKETGTLHHQFPASLHTLGLMEPVYEVMPGWKQPTTEARTWDDLPEACKAYLQRLEVLCEAPMSIVSVGPEREQTLVRRHPLQSPKRQPFAATVAHV